MPLLQKGVIVGQYIVTRKLGEGQFAEVWEVKLNSNAGMSDRFALKLEKKKERNTVKQEYKVLKRLQGTCSQVVAVTDNGTHEGRFYMVMQLLGESLFDARKQAGRLDVPTVKAISLSTLAAIEQLHQQNMIHRDIKPANFVIHPLNAAASKGTWLLIDFGLARRFTDDSGQHLQQRSDASFRGSTTYASVHSHKAEDLSRRDDLWSWLYMLVELLDGSLPWRQEQHAGEQHAHVDKHWVQQQKELCIQEPHRLAQSVELPEPLADVSRHLASLGFADTPDYQHLQQLLQRLPDQQQRLHSLTEPGRLLDNGQQSWDWAQSQQSQQQPQQWGDTGWQRQAQFQTAAAAMQNGQQQHNAMRTPESPPDERLSPLAVALVATAGKRPTATADSDKQLGKRRKMDSSKPRSNQDSHQLQIRQGTVALPSPADEGSTDSRPSSSQGRAGTRPPHRQAMLQPPHRHGSQRSRSRSRSRERQLERPNDGAKLRQDAGHVCAAAGQTTQGSIKKRQQSTGSVERAPASSAGGKAAEIVDLIAVFNSEAPVSSRTAVQQTVQAMLSLDPVEAVAAIGIAVSRVSEQTDAKSAPVVAQLLADLAAFVSSGSAKARRPRKG